MWIPLFQDNLLCFILKNKETKYKKSAYQDCVVSYYASALKNQIHLQIQTAPNHL